MIRLLESLLLLQRAKRGQFSVVFKIFEYLPEAKEAKAHLDYVIDLFVAEEIKMQKIDIFLHNP